MISPLVSVPAPSTGSGGGIRKDTPQPFHDWIASQAAPHAQVLAQPGGEIQTPAVAASASMPVQPSMLSGHDEAAVAIAGCAADAAASALPAVGAAMDRLPTSVSFVVQLHHRSGSVELIALPWRLVATGQLAHLFASHGSAGTAATAQVHAAGARPAIPGMAASAFATRSSIEAIDDARVAGDANSRLPASAALAAPDSVQSGPEDGAEHASVHGHAALPWTARLMRWVESNGGAATIWLRDYHLDENGLPHLVASLRAAAGDAGLRLDRIVINGKTQWHLHRSSRETTHAG